MIIKNNFSQSFFKLKQKNGGKNYIHFFYLLGVSFSLIQFANLVAEDFHNVFKRDFCFDYGD